MKSAMTAVWFLTVAIGNILVVGIALIDAKSLTFELLLFAEVVFMITGIFIGIGINYKYQHNDSYISVSTSIS